jgi:osmoprotectant transport system permease protein
MNFFDFIRANWRDVAALTGEHVYLVAVSILVACAVGLPAGVLLTRRKALRRPVLAAANVLQTVPSLALFGFLIPLPFVGIGWKAAVIALFLYALLPVIRNTVTGIEGVDGGVREAAVAMGMTGGQILRQVELPLAAPVILAGVRVATVISVGVTTIAAAIGAGGLGTYIFRGLRQNDNALILAGAVPAALLALAADAGFGLLEARFDARRRRGARAGVARAGSRRSRALASAAVALTLLALVGFVAWRGEGRADVVVGSKDFTESVLLAELLAQELEARGVRVGRRYELGGQLPHDSLLAGELDAYPEYTGTSYTAILKRPPVTDPRRVFDEVRREYDGRFRLAVSEPLGFSNDFAVLVRGSEARRLGLRTISEAAPHMARWRAGFGQDFMSRADGYTGFVRAYGLNFAERPREMDLSLSYRALAAGEVDLIAGNSTDGLIPALDLFQLEDDRRYFPPYEAVYVLRRAALERAPALGEALRALAGALTTEEMRKLNYEVDGNKRPPAEVVSAWRSLRSQK